MLSIHATLSETRLEHRTEKYRSSLPIVRRGFPVRLQTNATSLSVSLLPAHPRDSRLGPLTTFSVTAGASPISGWALQSLGNDFATLTIPPNARVGLYELSNGNSQLQLAVLFNPFSEHDDVYMSPEALREEHVLNEAGIIWRGSADSNYGAAWDYGHFNMTVLRCALTLLDRMPVAKRGDAVAVSRHLSAAVNAQDDNGVVAGRWDGSYSDGTPPTAWTGSVPLLTEFWNSRAPVRYGQCWVFAAVLTSLCRTLGLPCRTDTNFNSAHDTDRPYNRAVDLFFDTQGELLEYRTRDSVWNFHVWNAAWMKRPDLAADAERLGINLDGWQVLDATPQERSAGLFQLGPSPLVAIKRGFSLQYDTDFVIGEVNADVLFHWQRAGSTQFDLDGKNTHHVGKLISTKSVSSNRRNDVTLEYKFAEGTPEEREALARRPTVYHRSLPSPRQMLFKLSFPTQVKAGDTIIVNIDAANSGARDASVHFSSLYRAVQYTGAPVARIGKLVNDVLIGGGQSAQFSVEIAAEQYLQHLAHDVNTIKFVNSAKVSNTGQTWAEECIVRLQGDDALEVSAPTNVELGEHEQLKVTVMNCFDFTLTDVIVRASGEGVLDATKIKLGTIEAGESVSTDIKIDASEVGEHVLVVTLDSHELKDISESVCISVKDNSGKSQWESILGTLKSRKDPNWDELFTRG